RALTVHRVARERHAVLPADQPADAAHRGLRHAEVVAGADAVDQALLHGRHELAVPVQDPARAEYEQRVVERPRAARLALVHADAAGHVVPGAGGDEPRDERAVDVDRALPQAGPELVEALERAGPPGPGVRRVERHERLGQHGELRTRRGDL